MNTDCQLKCPSGGERGMNFELFDRQPYTKLDKIRWCAVLIHDILYKPSSPRIAYHHDLQLKAYPHQVCWCAGCCWPLGTQQRPTWVREKRKPLLTFNPLFNFFTTLHHQYCPNLAYDVVANENAMNRRRVLVIALAMMITIPLRFTVLLFHSSLFFSLQCFSLSFISSLGWWRPGGIKTR